MAEPVPRFWEKLGYTILYKPAPVELADIANPDYARVIDGSGCCGHKEFMKLYPLTLTEHPIAIFMDLDTILLKPLDHLFDILLLSSSNAPPYHIPTAEWNTTVHHPVDAFFVRDYNMNSAFLPMSEFPFKVASSYIGLNQTVFDEMKDLIRQGDFQPGRGWTADGWGGIQVGNGGSDRHQGLVSYYYSGLYPNTAVELHHCLYDQMVDPPWLRGVGKCRTGLRHNNSRQQQQQQDFPDCRKTDITKIHSAHFTMCKKPWLCIDNSTLTRNWSYWRRGAHDLCMRLHWIWHGIRRDLEETNGRRGTGQQQQQQHYHHQSMETIVSATKRMQPENADSMTRFYGHCRKDASAASKFGYVYNPLQLQD